MVWECQACSYIYSKSKGDPRGGVPPGTGFDSLPEDWKCPVCGVGREFFEKLSSPDD